jgi:hypothetical protein
MTEYELELRLRAVARELDVQAPPFDPARLRRVARQRLRRRVVAVTCAVVVGVVAAPTAFSALTHLFAVDEVPELGTLGPGIAPPFAGRSVPVEALGSSAPFRVRMIPSLGPPDEVRVRDDISGGMVTIVYGGGGILLSQWRTRDVEARIALVPVTGVAEDVSVGELPALWIAGTARGTFALTGADGAVHRESFEVGAGTLLWKHGELTYLLQGAGSAAEATRLAAEVED